MNLIDKTIQSYRDYSFYYNHYVHDSKSRALETPYIILSVEAINQLTDFEISEYYLNHTEYRRDKDLMAAIIAELPRMVRQLTEFTTVRDFHLWEAINRSNIEIVDILLPVWRNLESSELHRAAHSSSLEMIHYIIDKGVVPTLDTVIFAAKSGRLDLVKYLINNYKLEIEPNRLLNSAAESGNEELLKYVLYLGAEPDYDTLRGIVLSNNPNLFEYMPLFESTKLLNQAIITGKTEVIKYLNKITHPSPKNVKYFLFYDFNDEGTSYMDPILLNIAIKTSCPKWINYLITTFNLVPSREQIINIGFNSKVESFRYIYNSYNIDNLLPEILELSRGKLTEILIKEFNVKPTNEIIGRITNLELVKYIYKRYGISQIPAIASGNEDILSYIESISG